MPDENELPAEQHFRRLQQRGRFGTGITTDTRDDATKNETSVEEMSTEDHLDRIRRQGVRS